MSAGFGHLRGVLAALALVAAAGPGGPPARAASGPRAVELPPLSTERGGKRLPGKFVWGDLVTGDLAAAQRFYGGMFGWTFRAISPAYVIAYADERPLAGLLYRAAPPERPARPRWFGYVSVPDLGRVASVVTNSGGRVLAPREKVPGRGEQAVFADPEGAVFGAIRSSGADPGDFLADPGEWIWIQMMSRDARRAAEFYSRVAGYRIIENVEARRLSDFVLTSQGFARATVREIPESARDVAPTWLLFVRVAAIGEAVARSRSLGGTVVIEPRPEFLEGRVAVVADPSGAAVGLLEWSDGLVRKGGGS